MTGRVLTRVPPKGRRATILRHTISDFRTLDEVSNAVRAEGASRVGDIAIDRLKTRGAVKDLHRGGFLDRTPWGLRCTASGIALLEQSNVAVRQRNGRSQ